MGELWWAKCIGSSLLLFLTPLSLFTFYLRTTLRYFPTKIAVHHFLYLFLRQLVAEQEHQLRDGAFGGAVVAAHHTRLYQGQTGLVKSHVDAARLALRDVDHQESAGICILEFFLEPLQLRGIACTESPYHDCFQPGDVEHRMHQALLNAWEEREHHHIGSHKVVRLEGPALVGFADGSLVELDLHAHSGEVGIIERAERIELLGVNLRCSVAAHQLLLEIDADLGHDGRAVFVLGSSNLDGGDEVLLAVGTELTDGQLRTCEDDGLAQVLEHEAEGRCRVGHRVCAMQDDEAVEAVVAVGNDANQARPMLQPHVARVDGRVERESMDIEIEAPQLGHLVEDEVEVEALESTRHRVLPHAYRAACINKEHAGSMVLVAHDLSLYLCKGTKKQAYDKRKKENSPSSAKDEREFYAETTR